MKLFNDKYQKKIKANLLFKFLLFTLLMSLKIEANILDGEPWVRDEPCQGHLGVVPSMEALLGGEIQGPGPDCGVHAEVGSRFKV